MPFCVIKKKPLIFYFSFKVIKFLLRLNKIRQYNFIFFSTSVYWNHFTQSRYLEKLGFIPKSKNGILFIEHNINLQLSEEEDQYVKQYRLFTLLGFSKTQMLNPHYFGIIKPYALKYYKTKIVKFIIIGGLNKDCKNHKLLISSALKLVSTGINHFSITIIGKGAYELEIPKKLINIIKLYDRMPFSFMYEKYNQAKFCLAGFDYNNKYQRRYLTSTVSGILQLVLGFRKPILINKKFARKYNLSSHNSILYNSNNLS